MPHLVQGLCPELTQDVILKCKETGIKTATDFILNDPEELAKKIKTPYKDVLSIHRALIVKYACFPQNALSLRKELLESVSIIETSSKSLNKALCGGIYSGEITEIYGLPGSGKTQFCLSVASNLIYETRSTVFYLDSSCNFSAKRMEQILLQKANSMSVVRKLQNVKVKPIYDIYELFDCLEAIASELIKQEDLFFKYLKLLIIDSITPFIAPCFGGKFLDGLGLMSNMTQLLNKLCSQHTLSVLICNNTVQSKDKRVEPALGLNWRYTPSVSLCIAKQQAPSVYKMKVMKSCRSNLSDDIMFYITNAGIASDLESN